MHKDLRYMYKMFLTKQDLEIVIHNINHADALTEIKCVMLIGGSSLGLRFVLKDV